MTLKAYIWAMRALSLLSLGAFVLVAIHVDPDVWALPGKLIFYTCLFLFLASFLGLILLFLRRKTLGEESAENNLALSLRQGMLLGILFIILLILQSFRMLVWWDGLLVTAGVCLAELYFLSRN